MKAKEILDKIERWLNFRKKDNNQISVLGVEKLLIRLRNEMKNEEKNINQEVNLHLKDILDECKVEKSSDGYFKIDVEQIKHNVFEIKKHLGTISEK